jgi:hypothetical protein
MYVTFMLADLALPGLNFNLTEQDPVQAKTKSIFISLFWNSTEK